MSDVDEDSRAYIRECLGREPRGLRAVAVRSVQDLPMVIRVASLVDGRPFPTLFWLVDPTLALRIDREEAGGTIARLQARVDDSEALRASMTIEHQRHIALRESYISDVERAELNARGLWPALSERGIGGIADFTRIRCLHTWYAAHLVESNTIGKILESHWAAQEGSEQG